MTWTHSQAMSKERARKSSFKFPVLDNRLFAQTGLVFMLGHLFVGRKVSRLESCVYILVRRSLGTLWRSSASPQVDSILPRVIRDLWAAFRVKNPTK